MRGFYELGYPSTSDVGKPVYGRPGWENQFEPAEWSDYVDTEQVICPINPGHCRSGNRIGDLTIILPSPRIGDFTWTWLSECLLTERVLSLFRENGLIGFEVRPVTIEKVKRIRKGSEVSIPTLWELVVVGRGGDACPESGIRVIKTCEACGLVRYSSYRNGIIVDEEQWDGSDFFTINGYPRQILVTERVKDLIAANQLTNCVLIPSHEMRWPEGVVRPEEVPS